MTETLISETDTKLQQSVIVAWMRSQLKKLDWSPERWARESDLSPTTVTRAMSNKAASVTSVPTLVALSKSAGIPSVLDFLAGQTFITPNFPVMTVLLAEILPSVGVKISDKKIGELGERLGQAMIGMSRQPSSLAANEELARLIAQAACRKFD